MGSIYWLSLQFKFTSRVYKWSLRDIESPLFWVQFWSRVYVSFFRVKFTGCDCKSCAIRSNLRAEFAGHAYCWSLRVIFIGRVYYSSL